MYASRMVAHRPSWHVGRHNGGCTVEGCDGTILRDCQCLVIKVGGDSASSKKLVLLQQHKGL